MMWTLMRKDLRLLRPVFWGAAAMSVMFYVVLPAVWYLNWYHAETMRIEVRQYYVSTGYPFQRDYYVGAFARQVESGAAVMWIVDLVLLAVIGGTAFAIERRERWSDLPALLPISRGHTVAAKLRVSVAAGAALLVANAAVMFLAMIEASPRPFNYWNDRPPANFAENALIYVSLAVAGFGIAWLCSSLLRSPVVATAIAVSVVTGYYVSLFSINGFDHRGCSILTSMFFIAAGVIAGVAFTAIGVIVQWKRSSP